MGTVYLAEHTLIKRRVAIKILHPELATDARVVERFMNEARAAGTLGHPNIVESTDMGFTPEYVPYIVFEYLEGTLLTDEIYRVGGMPVRRAVRVAQQIASALHAAHQAGIVHRDLKSDNIFLTDKVDALDHVKVLDFGISRFMELEEQAQVMGTPEFMAPEQIVAPASVDRRADIYALGVILYEMLTARRPFSGADDQPALLRRIVHTDPPPLMRAEVPHVLADIVLRRMMAKDPADRFPSMLDVDAALAQFTAPGRSRQSDLIPRPANMVELATQTVALPAPATQRPWLMYALASAGLAVGALGVAVGLRGDGQATGATPTPGGQTRAAPQSVAVTLEANAPNARVTFRRRVMAAPQTMHLAPSEIVELVEVSAPGYRTMRYWLTFDRQTRLVARLAKGTGSFEATEEQTLVALGEIAATPETTEEVPAAAPVVAAQPRTVARKIGRAAAPPEEVAVMPEVALPEAIKPAARPVEPLAVVIAKPTDVPDAPTIEAPAYDPATVNAVVAQNRPVIEKCFADGKQVNPGLRGGVQVRLVVEPSGKVKNVQVQSTLKSPLVAACVAKNVGGWRFPARAEAERAHAIVSYPFSVN